MKIILATVLVAAVLATHPISHKIVDEINNSNLSWKAMSPEENPLSHLSNEEIDAMLGTFMVPTPEVLSIFENEQNL
jgi:hypothetical protein